MSASVWLVVITVVLAAQGTLAANIWPLTAFATMLVGAGHGLKGYTAFVNSKAAPTVTGSTNTQVTADLTKITEAIMKRRVESDHPGTEPAP